MLRCNVRNKRVLMIPTPCMHGIHQRRPGVDAIMKYVDKHRSAYFEIHQPARLRQNGAASRKNSGRPASRPEMGDLSCQREQGRKMNHLSSQLRRAYVSIDVPRGKYMRRVSTKQQGRRAVDSFEGVRVRGWGLARLHDESIS